ncbi:MAG: HAD-IB family hydrolase [Patescibacteria group bacterium]
MKKVAIFDVDGTIFRSSLLIEITEHLINKEVFPKKARLEYAMEYTHWANREGRYEEYIEAVVRVFIKNLKGVKYKDFMDVTEEVVEDQKKRTYRYTRDLVLQYKKRGYFLLAISQSPKGVLDKFCTHLGFDKVYGRVYEIGPDNRLTGQITDLHLIANKANIVKRAVEKEGLTLTDSIGVGDTEGDIPFLELVSHPICFNPNMALYRTAKRSGWKIVVERKDVIYQLN